jgi:hypothetical protein
MQKAIDIRPMQAYNTGWMSKGVHFSEGKDSLFFSERGTPLLFSLSVPQSGRKEAIWNWKVNSETPAAVPSAP